ncbi:aldehyde dehydrogenase family protein [Pectinatus sottacetonis]|uniref:aldehyde dehydrogenase family protein n=1 Tax=Pectinatus sottacetonis TaxID=1002795 RepID=UPI0018C83BFA|nr:aldehyde dehydrogenase family protein [Pectinatus sottacetonis]
MKCYELIIDGKKMPTAATENVYDKATGEVFAQISTAGEKEVKMAVDAAQEAFETVKLAPYQRYEIIMKAAHNVMQRQHEFAEILSKEAGKPINDAMGEIARAYQTLILSAEEAKRLTGEMVPIQGAPGCEKRVAYTKRMPLGVVCAITPFNFPVNLACHKIGPAIAAGDTVIYKPASATPLTAYLLCEAFADAGLPDGFLNLIMGRGSLVGDLLVKDERIKMISFTGSVPVGKSLQKAAGFRRVALELGSNSANIVHDDIAYVKKVAQLCAKYAFVNAGQVCISCQRVYVQKNIYDEFCKAAVEYAAGLKIGNPLATNTDIGPMIAEKEAVRIESWINEAVSAGAELLVGGKRKGAFFMPTILTGTNSKMKVICKETFAPVFSIMPYDNIEDAIAAVNDSNYGLQAGVFTSSLAVAHLCAEKIETGGVIINDGSTFRMDNMPYGGVKDSGIGREGPEYAVRELTEEKLVVFNFS